MEILIDNIYIVGIIVLIILYFFNQYRDKISEAEQLKKEIEKIKSENDKSLEEQSSKIEELLSNVNLLAEQKLQDFKSKELLIIQKQCRDLAIQEANNSLNKWKIECEASIRQDAINRSLSVIKGKVTEHIIPFHKSFPFNPKDARFIGSPIDMIVFDDLEDYFEIYFLEIKTGESQLSKKQKLIKEAILDGRVHWRELKI
jgi:predicted Holliday junction resolvase-like endonuclease